MYWPSVQVSVRESMDLIQNFRLYDLKSLLQTPLQRARWAMTKALNFPADSCDIAQARSMRSAREASYQPLDLFALHDGRRFVLKSFCEASEVRANLVALELEMTPSTWAVESCAFIQEFLPQAPLARQCWAGDCGQELGTSLAVALRLLHSAGLCYIDSMSRHIFSRKQNRWYLIDYGTALLVSDPKGPHSEVDHWLLTSPQSRARSAGAKGSLAHRGMLHDWLVWQGELKKAWLPLMRPRERQACVTAFETHYPCPPLNASDC